MSKREECQEEIVDNHVRTLCPACALWISPFNPIQVQLYMFTH